MKKKILILVIITALVVFLLLPLKYYLKDGGSVRYDAVLYDVTKYHQMTVKDGVDGFTEGCKVEVFGITVYDNTYFVESEY